MYGAFIGDIVGSIYEFNNIKTKDFPLFKSSCDYTDDSIMTVAVARALTEAVEKGPVPEQELSGLFVKHMQAMGRAYPNPTGAYGGNFSYWLIEENPQPYGSFGNGSAMRVSPCGLIAASVEEAELLARVSAAVSHNHPEGIKGAQATAAAVYMAKTGSSKEETRHISPANTIKSASRWMRSARPTVLTAAVRVRYLRHWNPSSNPTVLRMPCAMSFPSAAIPIHRGPSAARWPGPSIPGTAWMKTTRRC